MMKIAKLVFLVTALLALAACRPVTREGASAASGAASGGSGAGAAASAGTGEAETNPLAGTSWTLATLNGEAPLAETEITLNFGEDGNLSGSDGCNRFSTSYTVDGDSITIAPNGASTMMACPEPVMEQATALMTTLGDVTAYTVDSASLSLADASGVTVATFDVVSGDLAGTAWSVTNYNNGRGGVVGLLADTVLTVMFGESGQISGSGGCNNYSGSYESDGAGAIEIGPLVSTMMACAGPEGIMDQEMQFLAALQAGTVYTVEGSTLELRDADGALQVRAEKGIAESSGDAQSSSDAGTPEAAAGAADTSSSDGMTGMATVTGTVYYLQRSALPSDAMIEVSIHNKLLADAPPEMTLLAQTAFTAEGNQVPLPYTVAYAPADVMEGALYSIGATIRDGSGKLLFVSTTAIPVITKDNPTEGVEILVSPVK
jgi:heat shock protein HslJ